MSSVWWSHNGKLHFQEKQWKRELEMTLNQLFQSKLSCAFQMTETANVSQPHIQQSCWAGRLVITCVYVSEVKTYQICILSKKKGGSHQADLKNINCDISWFLIFNYKVWCCIRQRKTEGNGLCCSGRWNCPGRTYFLLLRPLRVIAPSALTKTKQLPNFKALLAVQS